uniref:AAA_8 domain-containing protein n=1 Tax=Angiostrongylus cantonensis TaxID=6313 RepID=A0A0K0DKB4_ANGCA
MRVLRFACLSASSIDLLPSHKSAMNPNILDGMSVTFQRTHDCFGTHWKNDEAKELFEPFGIRTFYMDEVEKRGIAKVMQEALYIPNFIVILFDGPDAPAVGTPTESGVIVCEFLRTVLTLHLSKLLATEIVVFSPQFDDQHKSSEKLVVNLMEAIYFTKFFQYNTAAALQERMQSST